MSEKIRVILADDHVVVLQGLRGLLEQEEDVQVIALVQNGDELLDCLEKSEADVVVLDLEMPYHGLTALEEIRKREIPVRVVVLTAFGDGSSIQSALELQAEGFALKTESPIQLIEAIRQVAKGRIIFPAAAQRWLVNQRKQEAAKTANQLCFHKSPEYLKPLEKPPFGAIDLSWDKAIYAVFTLGGLATDARARVLPPDGDAIAGLWAAGRTAASISPPGYSSGTSIGEAMIFGRIAGREAARA